jgi:hypothetical protein
MKFNYILWLTVILSTSVGAYSAITTPYTILGVREHACDAEILNLDQDGLKDLERLTNAYHTLLLYWHPTKIHVSPARERYAGLSDKEIQEYSREIFKFIDEVYKRNRKHAKRS